MHVELCVQQDITGGGVRSKRLPNTYDASAVQCNSRVLIGFGVRIYERASGYSVGIAKGHTRRAIHGNGYFLSLADGNGSAQRRSRNGLRLQQAVECQEAGNRH